MECLGSILWSLLWYFQVSPRVPFQHSLWGLWIHRYTNLVWTYFQPLWKRLTHCESSALLILWRCQVLRQERQQMRQQLRLSKRMERVTWLKLQGFTTFHWWFQGTISFWVFVTRVGSCYTAFVWTQQLGCFARSFAEGGTVGFCQQIPCLVTNQTPVSGWRILAAHLWGTATLAGSLRGSEVQGPTNCLAVFGWKDELQIGWVGCVWSLKSFPLSATSKPQIIPLSNPQKLGLFVGTYRAGSCISLSFWWQICYDFLGTNLHYARCGKIKEVYPIFWYLNKHLHYLWPWNPHVSNEKKPYLFFRVFLRDDMLHRFICGLLS